MCVQYMMHQGSQNLGFWGMHSIPPSTPQYPCVSQACGTSCVLGGHGNHLGGWYFCCRKQVAVTSAHWHTPQTHRHHDRPCRRCRPDPSEGARQEMDPYKPKYSATCGPPQLTLLQFPGSMCTLSAGSAGRAHGTGGVLVAEFSSKIPSQRGFAPCCLGIDRARTPTSR